MAQDFLVAGAKAAPALPLVLLAESSSVKVGGVARFLVASGIRGQALYLDVSRAGKLDRAPHPARGNGRRR